MNLSKLFETQAALDARIYESHPELKGQDNLEWKVLALQVELGECANEWRGFKKWSHDQEPRTKLYWWVDGKGDIHKTYEKPDESANAVSIKNPLLEEYVDCLHFILSIGLQKVEWYDAKVEIRDIAHLTFELKPVKDENIIRQFNGLFLDIGTLYDAAIDKTFDFLTIEIAFSNIWRTFIGLGEMLGFTWEQIEAAYYAKNKINHQRQEANY